MTSKCRLTKCQVCKEISGSYFVIKRSRGAYSVALEAWKYSPGVVEQKFADINPYGASAVGYGEWLKIHGAEYVVHDHDTIKKEDWK